MQMALANRFRGVISLLSTPRKVFLITFSVVILYVTYEEYPSYASRKTLLGNYPQLYRDVVPKKSHPNIYLVESSFSYNIKKLFLCSVESYCRSSPNSTVWFILTADDLDEGTQSRLKGLSTLYTNLRVVTADVLTVLDGTPLVPLLNSFGFWRSGMLTNVLSNMLRLAIVYKSGGFYSDSDVISHRNILELKNFIVQESSAFVTNTPFHFDAGHPFVLAAMEHIANNFQRDTWGSSGPKAFTKVLQTYCKDTYRREETMSFYEYPNDVVCSKQGEGFSTPPTLFHCPRLSVLHPLAYHAINYKMSSSLFTETPEKLCIEQLMQMSYGIHFSNKLTKTKEADVYSAANYVTARACPAVTRQ